VIGVARGWCDKAWSKQGNTLYHEIYVNWFLIFLVLFTSITVFLLVCIDQFWVRKSLSHLGTKDGVVLPFLAKWSASC